MEPKPMDIEEIFNTARRKRTVAERSAYLDEVCRDNPELRGRVEKLLKAHNAAGGFLEEPLGGVEVTLDDSPVTEGPGTKIGRYKLLELIGEGGFGVVYMAEQREPIRRRVALKIIKLGMDTKQVIARFEAERQALAMMEHPNIAKVLDAGATETGRPYFVMELVKGIRITKYCDKNNLDTHQRLGIFIDVCKAVQHAHQKGIIHRDIKPSNVLVTLRDDGTPVPKIIDFGIAKATQKSLTEKTLFTEFHQFVGTPEYMSPEQAQMGEQDVDTRSDIYSLGILLYELLTGRTPLERKELLSASYDQMLKIIREAEPPRPSSSLNTLGEALSSVAKHRQVEPGQLCKIIRGDLDWIVLKTLEKDRGRRYETANELAADIQRHLGDEPVVAGPPSTVYRLRKFVRRNRTAVAVVLAILAALIIGLSVATVGFVQASRERDRAVVAETEAVTQREVAEQAREKETTARAEAERQAKIAQAVADFLENDVLASVEPAKAKGPEVTVRYILDAASQSMGGKFEGEPLVEASIHQTLGSTYLSLGKYEAAGKHLERALAIHRELFGEEHPETAASIFELGVLYFNQGRRDEAEGLYVKALDGQRRVLGEEHPDTLRSMYYLASLYMVKDRHDEGEPLLVKTLQIQRRVLGEEHPDTLRSMFGLAWVYFFDQGRYDEAEPLLVKAIEGQRRVLGEEHPETLRSLGGLGSLYQGLHRYDEAETLLINVLEVNRRVLGEEHLRTLESMGDLADLYKHSGRYEDMERLYVQAIELERSVLGECHPETLNSIRELATHLYIAHSRYEEAEQLFIKVMETCPRVLGEGHPQTLFYTNKLIELYEVWGKPQKAEEWRGKQRTDDRGQTK